MRWNLITGALCVFLAAATGRTWGADRTTSDSVGGLTDDLVPLIMFEEAPLTDCLAVLARSMHLNHIQDPGIVAHYGDRGAPLVNGRWKQVRYSEALGELLTRHDLVMVTNPATTVARIARKDKSIVPVAVSQLGEDNSALLPLIELEHRPLDESIQTLASLAKLPVTISPEAIRGSPIHVSVRWENLTARQALAALLDNYDLILRGPRDGAKATIEPKPGTGGAVGSSGARGGLWLLAGLVALATLILSVALGWIVWRRV